jgi:hypothetical protein
LRSPFNLRSSVSVFSTVVFVVSVVSVVFSASPPPISLKVDFRAGGRCTVIAHDESPRSDRVVDVPGPAAVAEYRCAVPAQPHGRPIELSVLMPAGEPPAGSEFPRLVWTERDGRWIGTASLPAAPAFVRVPSRGSTAPRRARLLDWAALAATAAAIAWTIKFGMRD